MELTGSSAEAVAVFEALEPRVHLAATLGFAPAVAAPTGLALLAAYDTGLSSTDHLTNLNNSDYSHKLGFSVSGTIKGATVDIIADGTIIGVGTGTGGTITIITNGTHTVPDSKLPALTRITACQVVGSYSSKSVFTDITISTARPVTPSKPAITRTGPAGCVLPANAGYDYTINTPTGGAVQFANLSTASGTGRWQMSWYYANQYHTITLDKNNRWVLPSSYVPANNTYEFRFFAMSSAGVLSNSQKLLVHLDRKAPAAKNDNYTINAQVSLFAPRYLLASASLGAMNKVLTVGGAGILGNDADPEGAALTATKLTDPSHGSVTLNSNGTFSYTPDQGWTGTDSFTYEAIDAAGNASNDATVYVTTGDATPAISGQRYVGAYAPYTLNLNSDDADAVDHWTINWGDGTALQTVAGSLSSVQHEFASVLGNFTVSATATYVDGTTLSSNTLPASVIRAVPESYCYMVTLLKSASVDRGMTYSVIWDNGQVSSYTTSPTDNAEKRFVIDWGDGSSDSTLVNGIKIKHTFADGSDEGSHFGITVHLVDADSEVVLGGQDLEVMNMAPTLTVTGGSSVALGMPYTLNLSSWDPGQDTINHWTITWGDGTVTTVAGNPSSFQHTYTGTPRNYAVSATATDEDGTYVAQIGKAKCFTVQATINSQLPLQPSDISIYEYHTNGAQKAPYAELTASSVNWWVKRSDNANPDYPLSADRINCFLSKSEIDALFAKYGTSWAVMSYRRFQLADLAKSLGLNPLTATDNIPLGEGSSPVGNAVILGGQEVLLPAIVGGCQSYANNQFWNMACPAVRNYLARYAVSMAADCNYLFVDDALVYAELFKPQGDWTKPDLHFFGSDGWQAQATRYVGYYISMLKAVKQMNPKLNLILNAAYDWNCLQQVFFSQLPTDLAYGVMVENRFWQGGQWSEDVQYYQNLAKQYQLFWVANIDMPTMRQEAVEYAYLCDDHGYIQDGLGSDFCPGQALDEATQDPNTDIWSRDFEGGRITFDPSKGMDGMQWIPSGKHISVLNP